jgi:hypothetical protein
MAHEAEVMRQMRNVFELDDDTRSFLQNVLIRAAASYASEERLVLGDPNEGVRFLASLFGRQARQARALADILGDADAVAVIGDHETAEQIREYAKL